MKILKFLYLFFSELPNLLNWVLFKRSKSTKKLTKQSIKNYFLALWNVVGKDGNLLLEEQIMFRKSGVYANSSECMKQGQCVNCLCEMDVKLYEPDGCEYGCYEPLMSNVEWEKFKLNGFNK